ncbi:TPA: VWA domain-containing protein [Candidatus Poribacteria bacterium]|nr:VWA domain-containing protein [Candidatus Poribacteria bacterium]
MGFLNPIFLLGTVIAVVPLLIHLWNRHQAKTVDFSSLIFLQIAHRQSVRRIQIKHLIILILRMLILMFIALALARPILKNQFSLAGSRTKTSCVIILDHSYSMSYQDIDGPRFELAKSVAIGVVESLQNGDNVSIILMSDKAEPIFRKLTRDFDQVKSTIQSTDVSFQSTSISPALAMAHDLLTESSAPNKEIYLITDLGKNGWQNFGRLPNLSDARIFLLPIKNPVPNNSGIEDVSTSPKLIGVNIPIHLKVGIKNYSTDPVNSTNLAFFINNQKQSNIAIHIGSEERVDLTFKHSFELPGVHTGYLELLPDRLPIDNRRYFAVESYRQLQALCVGNNNLYLSLGLNPERELKPTEEYTVLPSSCSPDELKNFTLDNFDILILADLPELTDQVKQAIQSFSRAGKTIIIFVGNQIDNISYNNFFEWIPATFFKSTTWDPPTTISDYDSEHPIFEVFQDRSFSITPKFYRGFQLEPARNSSVIAKFQNQMPFIIERRIGKGNVLLFNVSVTDPSSSDLLVSPKFLPLLQQSVLYGKSLQSSRKRNLLVGQPYITKLDRHRSAVAEIHLTGDVSHTIPIQSDGTLEFRDTYKPGIYQINVSGGSPKLNDFFVVNVDPSESDLTPIDANQAADRISARTAVKPESDTWRQTLNSQRTGREIWGEMLVLATGLMLIESILSNKNEI